MKTLVMYGDAFEAEKLVPITEHFKKVAARLEKDGFLSPKVLKVDINALLYQFPGGMLSNLISQLNQQGKIEKLPEVLAD